MCTHTCTPPSQTVTETATPHLCHVNPPQVTPQPLMEAPLCILSPYGTLPVTAIVWTQHLYLHHLLIHVY